MNACKPQRLSHQLQQLFESEHPSRIDATTKPIRALDPLSHSTSRIAKRGENPLLALFYLPYPRLPIMPRNSAPYE